MQALIAPFARIFLRYLAVFLVAHGYLASDTGAALGADPDLVAMVEVTLGAAIGFAVEAWYLLARRFGWGT